MSGALVYLFVGLALAVANDRTSPGTAKVERLTTALLLWLTWPLFAPVVWLSAAKPNVDASGSESSRIERALVEAQAAVAGTSLASLLPTAWIGRVRQTLAELEARRAALGTLLARPDLSDPNVENAASDVGSFQRDSVARLRQLYARDEATLRELVSLVEALRTQMLVARFSAPKHGVEAGPHAAELAEDLAARVDSLQAWLQLDSSPPNADTHEGTDAHSAYPRRG